MTKAIIDIAGPLGIAVHDHIIVGRNGHASMKGAAADLAVARIYHLLTLRFALWRMRGRVAHRMRGGSSFSIERGSMMNQLAERIGVAALSMSPEHMVDKFLDWLEELRRAMALAEIDGLARNEVRTKVLFD
jgi:hypothetical protein